MKIVTVVGARPQFVKAAVVSRAIKKSQNINEIIIHTGQHYDPSMSEVFFQEMKIPKPIYNLGVGGLSHGAMTGQMLEKIEEVLLKEKPNWVLIYGDTNSTLAGALAAVKIGIPVAHVEAGLRSFNIAMPEEINRILADRISSLLLVPTKNAIDNLKREGIDDTSIKLVGDVMYDAALYYSKDPLTQRKAHGEGHLLVTLHRASNTDDPVILKSLIETLNDISEETPIICPLHPRTRGKIDYLGIKPRFKVIDPVGYFEMLDLLQHCSMVMTDSGGLQKEAYFFCKPCLTLRTETEWTELVDLKCNKVVGTSRETIIAGWKEFKQAQQDFSPKPYGLGDAGQKIVQVLQGKNL